MELDFAIIVQTILAGGILFILTQSWTLLRKIEDSIFQINLKIGNIESREDMHFSEDERRFSELNEDIKEIKNKHRK